MPLLGVPGYNSLDRMNEIATRRGAAVLAAVCCCAAVGACGGSAKPRPAASSGSLIGFAVCMRSHGVTNFPDAGPSSGPGGGVAVVPAGIDTSSPAFKQAFSVCDRLLIGTGQHQPASAQALRQMLRFSECMRSHGVSGFPDPTSTPPASHNGYSMMVRRGGAYLAIPDTISSASPAYQHAKSACRFGPIFS